MTVSRGPRRCVQTVRGRSLSGQDNQREQRRLSLATSPLKSQDDSTAALRTIAHRLPDLGPHAFGRHHIITHSMVMDTNPAIGIKWPRAGPQAVCCFFHRSRCYRFLHRPAALRASPDYHPPFGGRHHFAPQLRITRKSVDTILCTVVLLTQCFAAIALTDAPLPCIRFI